MSITTPVLPTSVNICTPELTTLAIVDSEINDQTNENCPGIANVQISERKFVVCHPHETSADYNLKVQWNRPGKRQNACAQYFQLTTSCFRHFCGCKYPSLDWLQNSEKVLREKRFVGPHWMQVGNWQKWCFFLTFSFSVVRSINYFASHMCFLIYKLIVFVSGNAIMTQDHWGKTRFATRCCVSKQNNYLAVIGRHASSLELQPNHFFYVVVGWNSADAGKKDNCWGNERNDNKWCLCAHNLHDDNTPKIIKVCGRKDSSSVNRREICLGVQSWRRFSRLGLRQNFLDEIK